MDAFVPEISQLWFRDREIAADDGAVERDGSTPDQLEALEELNDRVQAARSIY